MTPELMRVLITALVGGAFLGSLPLAFLLVRFGGYSRVPTPPLPLRRGVYQPTASPTKGAPPMPRKR
jgi:hypothetical protein